MPSLRKYIQQKEVLVIATGIVLGFALKDFIESFIASFITPILDKVYGGAGALEGKITDVGGVQFATGSFVDATITFAAILLVAYVVVYTYNSATYQLRNKEDKPKPKTSSKGKK